MDSITKPGVYDLTYAEYAAIDAVRMSSLKSCGSSMLRYRYDMDNPKPSTPGQVFGTVFHVATLEPLTYKNQVSVYAGASRKNKSWAPFVDANPGMIPVLMKEHMLALDMARATRTHIIAQPYITGAERREVSIVWRHEATGMLCKVRIDAMRTGRQGFVADLKSTRSAEEFSFARDIVKFGYHHQAAFYMDGFYAAFGKQSQPYKLIAVEKTPPHDLAVYTLPIEAIVQGRRDYERWLGKLADSTTSGDWPGMCTEEKTIDIPAYAYDGANDERLDLDE